MNTVDTALKGPETLRILLIPGAGGSGPDHWDHCWESHDSRVERVTQADWDSDSRAHWIRALDEAICSSSRPTVLVAHSLGAIAVCHWAASTRASILAALLVAPADVDGDWVDTGSQYEGFRPIPMKPLPFASVLVSSSDDPYLSAQRASVFAQAWGCDLEQTGADGHLGSDAGLGHWNFGKDILNRLIIKAVAGEPDLLPIVLRRSTYEELAIFSEMEQQADARQFIDTFPLKRHQRDFANKSTIYLSIERPGAGLVGYFMLAVEKESESVEFRRILIDENQRGIGQMAIKEMERYCQTVHGAKRIWLDVYEDNEKGKHIYEKLGYVRFKTELRNERALHFYSKALLSI